MDKGEVPGTVVSTVGLIARRGRFELGPIEFTIGLGRTLLIGRNGCGKSTLIETVVGLLRPVAGSVRIAGKNPHDAAERRACMRAVGLVPQDSVVPSGARVSDVLDYAAWLKGVSRRVAQARSRETLGWLGIADLADRRVGTMSGGERQRVSIAAALVHDPRLLVLDEPTVGLDPIQRQNLDKVFVDLSRDRALLISTHISEDLRGADRVLALGDGRLMFDGSRRELEAKAGAGFEDESALERGIRQVLAKSEGADGLG